MRRLLCITASLALTIGVAHADTGFYAGIAGGHARGDVPGELKRDFRELSREVREAGGTSSTSSSESDTVFKTWLGYRFTRQLAVEAGYADLGRNSAGASANIEGESLSIKFASQHKALFIDVVGTFPLTERLDLIARGGAARVRTKGTLGLRLAAGEEGIAIRGRERFSETVPKAGIGLEYALVGGLALRAEYERYFNVGDKRKLPGFEGDIDVFSLGVNYRF